MTPGEGGIAAHFRRAVADAPGKVWLVFGDEQYTYAEALAEVRAAAAALGEAGVGPGDRVLEVAPSTPRTVFTWLALMELGAVQVPVNPRGTDEELAGFVRQVEPRLVVTPSGPTPGTAGTAVVAVEDLFGVPAGGDDDGPADVSPGDVAVMIPTSGTTGRSKLVMQTHRAYVMAAEGFPWWLGLTGDDRLMTSLPLFHINAPAYSVLGSMAARASLVLLPSFSARGFLDSARRYGATQFNAIGAMVEILMRQPPRPDDADNPVRLCYTGPSPDKERHLEIERRFGWEVTCGYALSETPYGLIWPRGQRPYGTLGAPRQHPVLGRVNEARVAADGELELRNPAVMAGYFGMAAETAEVLVDGWLRTGDLVTDNHDGTYTFVGRKKQVIRRRGENLSPAEVEAVLERHPEVAEAAVVGVPSALSEEDVKAFVVPAPGGRGVDIAGLREFAAARLAGYKVPRYFEVVDDLPHTATGRLAKHMLPTGRTEKEVDMEADQGPHARAATGPRSWIGSATAESITVGGRDLPGEVMGQLTLTELAYLLVTRRAPAPGQTRLLDAVLVSLADHGLTPSAMAARLTYTGAPEAPQAAVAAGLLGAGSVFLGPTGDTAEMLAAALRMGGAGGAGGEAAGGAGGEAAGGAGGEAAGGARGEAEGGDWPDDQALAGLAREVVAARLDAGQRVPGLGHPLHRQLDPRVPRLYALAREEGLLGPHMRLLEAVAAAYAEATGRALPINGAGAAGAALADLGVPPGSARGFALIARTAGLVAHLAEEASDPIGPSLWADLDRRSAPPTSPP